MMESAIGFAAAHGRERRERQGGKALDFHIGGSLNGQCRTDSIENSICYNKHKSNEKEEIV